MYSAIGVTCILHTCLSERIGDDCFDEFIGYVSTSSEKGTTSLHANDRHLLLLLPDWTRHDNGCEYFS